MNINNWQRKGLIFKPKKNYSHTQLPVSINMGKKVRIFYSGRDKHGISHPYFFDLNSDNLNKIIYCHNKSIISLGEPGCFDDSGIMPACIIKIKHQYYLYYIGWSLRKNVPYSNAIGLAISKDGKFFKKFSKSPIFSLTNLEPYFTGTISVIKCGKLYYAYYLSCIGWRKVNKKMEPLYDIKIANSKDGITWNREGKVAIKLKKENEGGLASATIAKIKQTYHMWFSYRGIKDYRDNKRFSYRIGYAFSKNLYKWHRDDKKFNLHFSKNAWDSEMMAYPNVIKVKNNLILFYNGNGFGQTGIGYLSNKLF